VTVLRLAMLAVLIAAGTMLLGWWSVPVLGLLYGGARGAGKGRALEAGVGAALGWAGVLAWSAPLGPVWQLAGRAGGIFGLPGWGFLALTLVFAGLLAATAAHLGSRARRVLPLLLGLGACNLGTGLGPVGIDFTRVSAGREFSCGLAADGTAYCWSLNDSGQLSGGSEPAASPGRARPSVGIISHRGPGRFDRAPAA
jgi:hypothetical protein